MTKKEALNEQIKLNKVLALVYQKQKDNKEALNILNILSLFYSVGRIDPISTTFILTNILNGNIKTIKEYCDELKIEI